MMLAPGNACAGVHTAQTLEERLLGHLKQGHSMNANSPNNIPRHVGGTFHDRDTTWNRNIPCTALSIHCYIRPFSAYFKWLEQDFPTVNFFLSALLLSCRSTGISSRNKVKYYAQNFVITNVDNQDVSRILQSNSAEAIIYVTIWNENYMNWVPTWTARKERVGFKWKSCRLHADKPRWVPRKNFCNVSHLSWGPQGHGYHGTIKYDKSIRCIQILALIQGPENLIPNSQRTGEQ